MTKDSSTHSQRPTQISSGVPALDDVLTGDFTPHRQYLIEGVPGSGKTTLALQFLQQGIANNETVLYVLLSETESELREVAASHGWSADACVRAVYPRTASRAQDGLGIGSTLERSLVEMHDGSVTAASDGLGEGAEFLVRLPLSDAGADIAANEEAGSDAESPLAEISAGACRVLAVHGHIDHPRGWTQKNRLATDGQPKRLAGTISC